MAPEAFGFVFWITILQCVFINGNVSHLRLCVDAKCEEPISHARTLMRYTSGDHNRLSFAPNVDVIVYSKPEESSADLWEGEINGKRGYFPKAFVREYKILNSNLSFKVPPDGSPDQSELQNKQPDAVDLPSLLPETVDANLVENILEGAPSPVLKAEGPAKNEHDGVHEHVDSMADSTTVPSQSDVGTTVEQTLKDSVQSAETGVSTESLPYATPESSLNSFAPLENIIAHTSNAYMAESSQVANSAVWFPEESSSIRPSSLSGGDELGVSTEVPRSGIEQTTSTVIKSQSEVLIDGVKHEIIDGTPILQQDDFLEDTIDSPSLTPKIVPSPTSPMEAFTDESSTAGRDVVSLTDGGPSIPNSAMSSMALETSDHPVTTSHTGIQNPPEVHTTVEKVDIATSAAVTSSGVEELPEAEKSTYSAIGMANETEGSVNDAPAVVETKIEEQLSPVEGLPDTLAVEKKGEELASPEEREKTGWFSNIANFLALDDKETEAVQVAEESPLPVALRAYHSVTSGVAAEVQNSQLPLNSEPFGGGGEKHDDGEKDEEDSVTVEMEANGDEITAIPHEESVEQPVAAAAVSEKSYFEDDAVQDAVMQSDQEVNNAEKATISSPEVNVPSQVAADKSSFTSYKISDDGNSNQDGAENNISDTSQMPNGDVGDLSPMAVESTGTEPAPSTSTEAGETTISTHTDSIELSETFFAVEKNDGVEGIDTIESPDSPVLSSEPISGDAAAFLSEDVKSKDLDTTGCYADGFEGSCGAVTEDYAADRILEDQLPKYEQEEIQLEGQDKESGFSSAADWIVAYAQIIIDSLPHPLKNWLAILEERLVSPRVVVVTVIVATFLLFSEIFIVVIRKRCKEGSLIAKIGALDKKLFAAVVERDQLQQQLSAVASKTEIWEGETIGSRKIIEKLQAELKSSKNECGKLQAEIASLEEQLGTATDAGLELNKMLSEFLTSQSDGGKLQDAVRQLQEQLEMQQSMMTDLQLKAETASREQSTLAVDLKEAEARNFQLEEQNQKANRELEDLQILNEGLKEENCCKEEQIVELQKDSQLLLKEADIWNESVAQLQDELNKCKKANNDLSESLSFKTNEIEALKDCVIKLKVATDADSPTEESESRRGVDDVLQKLMDASAVKAELQSFKDENSTLTVKLQEEIKAKLLAEDTAKSAVFKLDQLLEECQNAVRAREEAQTKLNVLSNYFKEKEMQLQKELGVQETMRQQTQDNVVSVTQRIATYEQEIELYKSQVTSLKAEIENQERSYKTQITHHDKKAHENWLAARAAERKLEDSKQETAALRNKLTLLEQEKANQINQSEIKKTQPGYPGSNGEIPSPPRLGSSDRCDSIDLPTSSRSSVLRDPIEMHRGLPFLPPDRPLPPFLPPPRFLPPLDDRGGPMLPPPPFDPRRAPFPIPPMPPPPGVVSPPPLDHWMAPRRRGSPPPYDRGPHPQDMPPMNQSSNRMSPSARSFDGPPHPRRAASDSPPPLRGAAREGRSYDVDYRDRTPPARFFEPPPPTQAPPPLLARGGRMAQPPPPPHLRRESRDMYPPGRPDGRMDPRRSSPLTSQNDASNATSV